MTSTKNADDAPGKRLDECPVCGRKSTFATTMRCRGCGADFYDADVRALARAHDGEGTTPGARAQDTAAGALASSRVLWLPLEPTQAHASLRKLAGIGAALLIAAFFIPLSPDYASFQMAWSLLDRGQAVALLLPPVAAALGLAAALIRPLAIWQCAALLVVPAAVGLLTLPALGHFAGTPHTPVPLFLLGMSVAGAALIVRILRPTSREARHGVVLGAVLALIGQLVPVADPTGLLPVELLFYPGAEALGPVAMPVAAPLAAFSGDMLVLWVCLYLLLPLALLPAAALAAWPRPRGPWDQWDTTVRALTWLVVLYLPLGFALYLFDMMGWGLGIRGVVLPGSAAGPAGSLVASWDDFLQASIIGRTRMGLLATAYALWLHLGLAALYMHLRPGDRVPRARMLARR